ncbi:hypothetical protein ACF0H5_013765 [Mactra antiquata]
MYVLLYLSGIKLDAMQKKEDQGYRNPAYIHDEGPLGDGPDTRSSLSTSSTSSRSSNKVMGTKLKVKGRQWYFWLAVIILIVIVIIVTVTTILVLKNKSDYEPTSSQVLLVNVSKTDNVTTSTSMTSSSSPTTEHHHTTREVTTTTLRTTTATTTTEQTAMTTQSSTSQPTHSIEERVSKTTTTTTTAAPSTVNTTTRDTTVKIKSTTTTPVQTTRKSTIASTTTSTTQTKAPVTTVTSQTSLQTTTTYVTNGNLSVAMSTILYNPDDVKSVTLRCNGRHKGDWKTITIRRQFKDSYEPVAVGVLNNNNDVEVFKFYPNVSHTISFGEYDVALTLVFDPFSCHQLTNFTCAFANEFESVTGRADIAIYMPPPQITLPHSIVENSELTLNCVAEVWGSTGSLVWKFKPEYATNFMEFSVEPTVDVETTNCTTRINSTLNFNPTMYENGAEFRCEIVDTFIHSQVKQTQSDDVTFKVVPSNYCEGKRQFTIHPHPHGPCTLVVYCLDTGPLVYEIECEPGQCYDYVKTACVAT